MYTLNIEKNKEVFLEKPIQDLNIGKSLFKFFSELCEEVYGGGYLVVLYDEDTGEVVAANVD